LHDAVHLKIFIRTGVLITVFKPSAAVLMQTGTLVFCCLHIEWGSFITQKTSICLHVLW